VGTLILKNTHTKIKEVAKVYIRYRKKQKWLSFNLKKTENTFLMLKCNIFKLRKIKITSFENFKILC
jgi:formylmethanofuran dehydrogenase subunit E